MSDAASEAAMRIRREVLGDAHVDQVVAATTELDGEFQRLLTEYVWGSVWTRAQLDRRTRSLITIALLAALGHHEELEMHLQATRATGASTADVADALLHVAVYAGVPAANRAFAIAKSVLEEGVAE